MGTSQPGFLRRLFAPFPSYSGTTPPAIANVTDLKALNAGLKELTRPVDQQWQASDQLAQRAGVVLGFFTAIVAALLAIPRNLPTQVTALGITTLWVLGVAIGLSVYATRAQDIRIAPSARDIVTQASQSEKQAKFDLLGFRLDDLSGNARILNRTASAYVLAVALFPVGVLLLLLLVA
jgi:hypothetical protein